MATILVVDDRESNRELIVALLRHGGHDPIEASDGAEALELARSRRPRIVISDILMPTMDGYEFARQLRADPGFADTQIIFHTAHYRAREARSLAEACGVFRVLTKPCEPEDILGAVEDALQARPAVAAQAPREFSAEHVRLLTDKLAEKTAELRSVSQKIAAQYELNLQFASVDDPHELLALFCRGARELIGAKYAIVAVESADGARGAPFMTVSGMDAAASTALTLLSVAEGSLGQVFSERRSRRFSGATASARAMGLPRGFPPVQFALAAPIVSLDQSYGWVCLADKIGASDFNGEDELLVAHLAMQVARIHEKRNALAAARGELAALRSETDRRREAARTGATLAQRLNNNEREIVRLVVAGKSTAEVGEALRLSPRTVETYRARLMHKLGIEDMASLVKFAIRSGISPLD